ncbi:hypothetical protein E5288_WYG004131 [Bos mutus]|uniref:Uncharacterized protein n=1 Tax=Bos mutus TaxID=72004 RepID=A0A6B0R4L2_9CETA|nr:hypothetical protein [Bos mutus]
MAPPDTLGSASAPTTPSLQAQLHLLSSTGIDVCLLCHLPSGDMRPNTARTLLVPASLDREPLLAESVGLSADLWGKLTNTVVTGLIRSTIKGRSRHWASTPQQNQKQQMTEKPEGKRFKRPPHTHPSVFHIVQWSSVTLMEQPPSPQDLLLEDPGLERQAQVSWALSAKQQSMAPKLAPSACGWQSTGLGAEGPRKSPHPGWLGSSPKPASRPPPQSSDRSEMQTQAEQTLVETPSRVLGGLAGSCLLWTGFVPHPQSPDSSPPPPSGV